MMDIIDRANSILDAPDLNSVGWAASRVMRRIKGPAVGTNVSLELTGSQTALWNAYWTSNETVREIGRDHNIRVTEVWSAAGPATLEGFACEDCNSSIDVLNRTELHDIERQRQLLALSGRTFHKHPRFCRLCSSRHTLAERLQGRGPSSHGVGSSYKEYLLSAEWMAIRQRALFAAQYCCQLCSSPNDLHVHHRTYVRVRQEELGDLTVLCRDCHIAFHAISDLYAAGTADPARIAKKHVREAGGDHDSVSAAVPA